MFESKFTKFDVNLGSSAKIYSFWEIGIPKGFYPTLPYIFRSMLWRSKINMNTFLLIVGNPRTSKSYCAMRIAEIYEKKLKKKFDVETQLTFSDVKKFLIWSQNAENSIFILDETGTTLNPDQFWSLQQRIMRRFVQTQGFRKNVLIWVLPSIIFIQKGFRFMTNYALETIKQGTIQVNKVVVRQLTGKGFPEFREIMNYGYPNRETVIKYEKMKKEWNDKDLKDDISFLDQLDSQSSKLLSKSDVLELLKNGKIDPAFAQEELYRGGISWSRAELLIQNKIMSDV